MIEVPSPESRAAAEAYVRTVSAQAAILPDIDPAAPLRRIAHVAVIGGGTMGGGIAMAFANANFDVTLIDVSESQVTQGISRIQANYAHSVGRGRLDPQEMERRLARIRSSTDIGRLADADLIVEAVFEDMDLKRDLFRKIDAHARPGAILGTNTSTLDIDSIARVTNRPEDVIGIHFFSPASVMPLLEVIRAKETATEIVATIMALGRQLGKVSVQSLVYPGFIGNAMFAHYGREAIFLVEEGNTPQRIDKVMTDFGFPMGFLAVADLAGNDVGIQQRRKEVLTRERGRRYPDLGMTLCDLGRLGQKTGVGWYRYDPGDRTPHPDPSLEPIVGQYAVEHGIAWHGASDEEILERCLFGIVNEGARLLELGVALRPGDVDAVFVNGYGFPAWRGGPLYFADHYGLDRIAGRVTALHEQHGDWWEPAPLLLRLAAEGKRFSDLAAASQIPQQTTRRAHAE